MAKYYCHECGTANGFLRNISTNALLGSTYQLDKYLKHTAPSSHYDVSGVFNDPSTAAYGDYIVSASCRGSIEVDDANRKNIICYAGRETGARYLNGHFDIPTDTVKVVLSSGARVHAYPVSSTEYATSTCCVCGKSILS